MANTFHRGETIICSIEVKDADGNYVDPATSMTITITDFMNSIEVDGADMVKDATGKYHYDWTSDATTAHKNTYKIFYTATDGARVTIEEDSFILE